MAPDMVCVCVCVYIIQTRLFFFFSSFFFYFFTLVCAFEPVHYPTTTTTTTTTKGVGRTRWEETRIFRFCFVCGSASLYATVPTGMLFSFLFYPLYFSSRLLVIRAPFFPSFFLLRLQSDSSRSSKGQEPTNNPHTSDEYHIIE